jgi:hypothetical protein
MTWIRHHKYFIRQSPFGEWFITIQKHVSHIFQPFDTGKNYDSCHFSPLRKVMNYYDVWMTEKFGRRKQ